MARIRTIKPEYWTHPDVLRLSIAARTLFVALLNFADDEGRLFDQPRKIAGNVFGDDDDVNVDVLLDELARLPRPRIFRYDAGGQRAIQVRNFNVHQVISKARPSSIPAPLGLQEPSGKTPELLPVGREVEGNGMEGEPIPEPLPEQPPQGGDLEATVSQLIGKAILDA